jgi:hypothetical protein
MERQIEEKQKKPSAGIATTAHGKYEPSLTYDI